MNEMWTALEQYQPFAERRLAVATARRRMTTERTEEAAWRAVRGQAYKWAQPYQVLQ